MPLGRWSGDYLFNVKSTPPLATFRLTTRLHVELGWTDYVRHATTRNPDAIGYLIAHPEILPRCQDPYTLLEEWTPMCNLCVYWIRHPKGCAVAEWVISDGVFNQFLPASRMIKKPGGPDEPVFEGLLGDVIGTARAEWSHVRPNEPFPLFPGLTGVPDGVILHRYETNEAVIGPYAGVLDALTSKPLL